MIFRTASFTRCLKSVSRNGASLVDALSFGRVSTAAWLLAGLFVLTLGFGGMSYAQSLKVREATLEHSENEYQVNANFEVELSPTLEDALNRGVPLYFVLEFRLWQARWWWFDRKIAAVDEVRRLTYNALTRQYRLSIGSLHKDSSSLYDALDWLGSVRGSPAVNRESLLKGATYSASLSLRLDASQLPKPLQLDAVTSKAWRLASSDYTWDVHISR
jgi:hypothetical protein